MLIANAGAINKYRVAYKSHNWFRHLGPLRGSADPTRDHATRDKIAENFVMGGGTSAGLEDQTSCRAINSTCCSRRTGETMGSRTRGSN